MTFLGKRQNKNAVFGVQNEVFLIKNGSWRCQNRGNGKSGNRGIHTKRGSSKSYSVSLDHLTTSYDKSISYVVLPLPALPKAAVNENEHIGYFELGNIMIWSFVKLLDIYNVKKKYRYQIESFDASTISVLILLISYNTLIKEIFTLTLFTSKQL